MKFFRKKKKSSKKNKKDLSASNNIFSVSTFVSLAVINCLFQYFLYKRIEDLNIEKDEIKEEIVNLENEKIQYESDYNSIFDQNEELIANRFYGFDGWKKKTLIKKYVLLD